MFLSRPRPSLVTIQPDKIDRSLFECFELVSVLDLLPSKVKRRFSSSIDPNDCSFEAYQHDVVTKSNISGVVDFGLKFNQLILVFLEKTRDQQNN